MPYTPKVSTRLTWPLPSAGAASAPCGMLHFAPCASVTPGPPPLPDPPSDTRVAARSPEPDAEDIAGWIPGCCCWTVEAAPRPSDSCDPPLCCVPSVSSTKHSLLRGVLCLIAGALQPSGVVPAGRSCLRALRAEGGGLCAAPAPDAAAAPVDGKAPAAPGLEGEPRATLRFALPPIALD